MTKSNHSTACTEKQTRSLTKRISCLFRLLICCCVYLASSPSIAAEFNKVELDDAEFLLLDAILQDRQLLSAAESYQSGEHILLPASQMASALGLGVEIDASTGKLVIINDGETFAVELLNDFSSIELKAQETAYHWGHDGFEIYASHLLLEQILRGTLDVTLSRLTVNVSSTDKLFPLEKRWVRDNKPVARNHEKNHTAANLYVSDKYQLLTPPTANVSLNVTTGDDGFQHNTNAGYVVQTVSDILYHSAKISLNQSSQSSDINSRINFTRYQPSPGETLWGGLSRYSFGDISVSSQSLLNKASSGLGIELSNRPANISRSFGTQNIEGDAPPGWEVELYRNGFLLERSVVSEHGRYLFADQVTEYGNNNFEIRLFGPYGEEEIRHENINIGSNWLPKGEFAYDAYVLDRHRNLLDDSSSNSSSGFASDAGFSFDYSPFTNTNIGSFYQLSRDDEQQEQHFFGAHSQTALNNLLLDLEFVKQLDAGYQIAFKGVGTLPWGQNYQVTLEERNRFSATGAENDNHSYLARFASGGLLPFTRNIGYRGSIEYSKFNDQEGAWLFSSRLSSRLKGVNFSNSMNYRLLNDDNSPNSLWGEMNVNSTFGKFRLTGTAAYRVEPTARLSRVAAAVSWRDDHQGYHTFDGGYSLAANNANDDIWDLGYTYSFTHDNLIMYLTSDYDSQQEWSVGIGVNFFLDYDTHNKKLRMSSKANTVSGNLNVSTYLDRNNNNRRDEGDWALDQVSFGPLPLWQGRTTNHEGQVVLPGVPAQTPFTFRAQWQDGVSSKDANYTLYTHPGSRVSVEIPFVVRTNISGFAIIDINGQEQALTTGRLELVNLTTDTTKELNIDMDGFFEATNLQPGHYRLQINADDLQRLNLVAEQGTVEFTTPETGGDYELPAIVLLRANQAPTQLPEMTQVVLNDDIGSAFYFGDQRNNDQIYSAPQDPQFQTDAPSSTAAGNDQLINEAATAAKEYVLSLAGPGASRDRRPTLVRPQQDTGIRAPQQSFQVQVGAYGQRKNAQRWLDRHPKLADKCSISRPSQFYIVACGQFNQRQQAVDYQIYLRTMDPAMRSMVISRPDITDATTASVSTTVETSPYRANTVDLSLNQGTRTTRKLNTADSYTIQLLVASQPQTVSTFVARYELDKNSVNITNTERNSRPVQILTFGNFGNPAQARTALAELPAGLQQQAWIKKYQL